jgi:hypothetical protein
MVNNNRATNFDWVIISSDNDFDYLYKLLKFGHENSFPFIPKFISVYFEIRRRENNEMVYFTKVKFTKHEYERSPIWSKFLRVYDDSRYETIRELFTDSKLDALWDECINQLPPVPPSSTVSNPTAVANI